MTRNISHFEVVNPVEERSDDEEKSVTNHNGNCAREHEIL